MILRDLLIYARILRRRWWLIVALCVVTVGATVFLSRKEKPTYRAWIKLQVAAPPPSDVSLYSSFRDDDFRDEVAYTRAAFTELLNDGSLAWSTLSKVETTLNEQSFMARTSVETSGGSNLIRVGVSADTPEEAQALVSALVDEALTYYSNLQTRPTMATRKFISQELEAIKVDLIEAERALTQFKIENKVGDLDSDIKRQQNLVLALTTSRDDALAKGDTEISANYDKIIIERQTQTQGLISLSTEYESLVTAVNLVRGTYNLLLSKETEAKIKENQILNGGFIQIISPARLPRNAISPLNPKIVLLSGILSLITGVMLAFVWDYVETNLGEAQQTAKARESLVD